MYLCCLKCKLVGTVSHVKRMKYELQLSCVGVETLYKSAYCTLLPAQFLTVWGLCFVSGELLCCVLSVALYCHCGGISYHQLLKGQYYKITYLTRANEPSKYLMGRVPNESQSCQILMCSGFITLVGFNSTK